MNDKIEIELAEDEDLARAKAWWKENGSSIIGGVLIGTSLVVGYNYWNSYQENHALEVAQLYEQFSQSPTSNDALDALLVEDSSSAYAQLARLNAAKEAAQAGDLDRAEALLNGALDSSPDRGLKAVTVLRLATVYQANGKVDAAIELLTGNVDAGLPLMQARADELLGDIYAQKGEADTARKHYQSAITSLTEIGQPVQFVQLKLDNL